MSWFIIVSKLLLSGNNVAGMVVESQDGFTGRLRLSRDFARNTAAVEAARHTCLELNWKNNGGDCDSSLPSEASPRTPRFPNFAATHSLLQSPWDRSAPERPTRGRLVVRWLGRCVSPFERQCEHSKSLRVSVSERGQDRRPRRQSRLR